MVDYKNTFLKCQTSLVVKTTSLELENFIKEVTGYPYPILDLLDGNKRTQVIDIESTYDYCLQSWNHFKETGDVNSYASINDALYGLAKDGNINYGTYHIEIVVHDKKDLLTSDAKDVLYDACIDVCNAIRHTKHSNLHMDMVSAVWDAANKVLRAHAKNS